MANWTNKAITEAGKALIAQAQSQGISLTITKCSTSSHNYSGTVLSDLIELVDIRQTVTINEKNIKNVKTIVLSANFNNAQLELGYYLYAYGIYGKIGNGAETLILVAATNNPDVVPKSSDGLWQAIINSNITIDDTDNITVNVDLAANATIGYVNDKVNEVNERFSDVDDEITDLDDAKLDKKTTTGQFAYSHNGATQSEIEVSANLKASTIPQRDGSGNLLASTPVGNYDNYVVNKGSLNKVTEVSIPTTGWTKNNTTSLYNITINVSNMYPSYVGTKDAGYKIVNGNYLSTIETIEEAFSHIKAIFSNTGSITLQADAVPTTAFTLLLYGL